MKAHISDDHKIEGTFYVIANLKELFGQKIPQSAFQATEKKGTISTDVDICYTLLFEERIMLSPPSYLGLDPHLGYLRITCSGGIQELKELLDRIEHKLKEAQLQKIN